MTIIEMKDEEEEMLTGNISVQNVSTKTTSF